MMTLKRSHDRKVTNSVTPNGKNSNVANAFGLPAGKAYSCPGATSVCESVCYAGALERQYSGPKGVLANMLHNWNALKDASYGDMVVMISLMIREFRKDSLKRNAPMEFRIHWDGDFFSRTYASAWATVITANPDINFWVYTRSFTNRLNVVDILVGIPNLSVYLSVDHDNEEWAKEIIAEYPAIRIAALSDTMVNAGEVITDIRGGNKPGAKCPELIGAIPLISLKGSACISCQLCPKGKADIRFASKKAGRV
jgi:ferredoxin